MACILLLLAINTQARFYYTGFFFNTLTDKQAADTTPTPAVNASDTGKFRTDFRSNGVLAEREGNQSAKDSLPKDTAAAALRDTAPNKKFVDTFKLSKDSLEGPVEYEASDSGVILIATRQMYLYGKAKASYQQNTLEAHTIEYDAQLPLFKAYGGRDTASNDPMDKPKLTQADQTVLSDTIFFNPNSKKGRTVNSIFKEGEMLVHAQYTKKVDSVTIYARHADFTTCDLDTPHFAFRSNKVKIVNNSFAYSGLTYPMVEGIPLPVPLPFGVFPLKRGRHSGMLAPQFANTEGFGIGLEGLGYYKVLSDYWDMTTRANIYSYGTWMVTVAPRYFKRYKYSGNFSLNIQNTKILNSGGAQKDEFTKSRTFNVAWSHSMDSKARPGVTFSASVNAGSTQFNRNLPNNPMANYQNNLQSTINYTKTWGDGKYSLTTLASHNQNSVSRLVNVTLPSSTFNVNTFYPFKAKEQVGTERWYEKLGLGYNVSFQNQASFYDSAFSFRRIQDTLQYGARHNIPITLTLPAMGALIATPSISYEETWFGQQINRTWNNSTKKIDTSIHKGLYTARQVQFGMNLSTRIFGTYNFNGSGLKAIRHEVKPFIALNYKPDLAKKDFYNLQYDSLGRTTRVSRYEGGLFGAYSEGAFGGLSFGIDNLLEMKVRDKNDTSAKATKKVKLIDGLSINSAYNFFADSLKLSPFALSMRSTLFEKINITGSATINPYRQDSFGRDINRYAWSGGRLSIGRLSNANIAVSTSLQSKSKDGKTQEERLKRDEYMTNDEQLAQLAYARNNPGEFTDFNIPWSVQLGFSVNLTRTIKSDYTGYQSIVSSSLNASGDFSLTPKWKLGGSGYFDVVTRKIQTLTMFISREMHCWQLNINVTPIGYYRSFNISFYPKSGILRDLKINRTRTFSPF